MTTTEIVAAVTMAVLGFLSAELRRWAAARRIKLPDAPLPEGDSYGERAVYVRGVGCPHRHAAAVGLESYGAQILWCSECGALKRDGEGWAPPTGAPEASAE